MSGEYYTRAEFAAALALVGVTDGDVVFSHSNIGFFGRPSGAPTAENAIATAFGALSDVIGARGTIAVPTFTLSFCKGRIFDVAESVSHCGSFAEAVRRRPDALRSADPLFSVAAVGGRARALTAGVGTGCFGRDSVWERLIEHDAIVCNLNLDAGSTLLHHVEWRLGVSYRQDRTFAGTIVEAGVARDASAIYFSRDLNQPECEPAFERFDRVARERGLARTARIGRGAVVAIRARDAAALVADVLVDAPRFLTRAGDERSASLQNAGRN